MNTFYIYGHYTADTDELFYIGKGSGRRAWSTSGRNKYWKRKVKKYGLVVKLLHTDLEESIAFELEKQLITEVGLDNLTNIIEGGDGPTSDDMKRIYHTPEMKRKAKQAGRTRAQDPQWKTRHDEAMRRNAQKPEVLEKLRALAKRKSQDEGFKKRQSVAIQKVTQTDEWKQKYRKATWDNPEWVSRRREISKTFQKEFMIISPTGEILHERGKAEFCRKHGLKSKNLRHLLNGTVRSYKGWKRYVPPNEKYTEFFKY